MPSKGGAPPPFRPAMASLDLKDFLDWAVGPVWLPVSEGFDENPCLLPLAEKNMNLLVFSLWL